MSLLSRLFRRRSPSKKRTTLNSFNAQFPPPEWLEPGKVIHLHSVAVQTQSADMAAAAAASAEVFRFLCHISKRTLKDQFRFRKQTRNGGGVMSSNRSECSTSLSFSSPTPTRRSMQRRVTLSQPPSRSDSCSPLRGVPPAHPMTAGKLDDGMTGGRITRCSPATSISSGLGRSFSPASANSYQRPMGILSRTLPSKSRDGRSLIIRHAFLFRRESQPAFADAEHGLALLLVRGAQRERHLPLARAKPGLPPALPAVRSGQGVLQRRDSRSLPIPLTQHGQPPFDAQLDGLPTVPAVSILA